MMAALVALLLLAVILAPVFWVKWVWKTFRRKRNTLLKTQVLISLAIIIETMWILRIFPGSSQFYLKRQVKDLTGYSLNLNEIFVYESPRAFNGDGYSIWVYEIEQKDSEVFISPRRDFLTRYPIKSEYRDHWKQQKWRRTPIREPEKDHLHFALSESLPNNHKKSDELKSYFSLINSIMLTEGNFYAFNYLIGNIDFYIISPSHRKLIVINHNT